MNGIPRRTSLVEQTAEILRQGLATGRWRGELPGELHLSETLQVSRSTLRAALDILHREGAFRVTRGRRRQLSPLNVRTALPRSTTVAVVSSLPLHEHSASSILTFHELRRRLQAAGFELQFHSLPQTIKAADHRRLESLVEPDSAACWVLSSCSIGVQRWFLQRGLPTLVLGSCHQGLDLPCFQLDAAAACRHALGVLHRHGHRHIGLLLPNSPFAGSVKIEASLRQTCLALSASERMEPIVRHHSGGVAGVEQVTAALLRLPSPPTALIVMMPRDALTVLCHLLLHRWRVPDDISLVSLFDDTFMENASPALARYRCDHSTYARRLARQVIEFAKSGATPRSISVLLDFFPGATIGRPEGVAQVSPPNGSPSDRQTVAAAAV